MLVDIYFLFIWHGNAKLVGFGTFIDDLKIMHVDMKIFSCMFSRPFDGVDFESDIENFMWWHFLPFFAIFSRNGTCIWKISNACF